MKYFKFWVRETFDISVKGKSQRIQLLAGSNISKDDAFVQAKTRAELIEQRIVQDKIKEEYEVAIKEHVVQVLDAHNMVSVCRYGAKFLNTTQYTILDLDDYPVDFFDIFRALRKLSKKERIVHKFLQRVQKYPQLGTDFRIYETTKGIRVIGKKYIDPAEVSTQSLLQKLAVDWVYIVMARKQHCYRARLTPKPYRMKIKTIKIKSPLDCELPEYLEWSSHYEKTAKNYSVVKLLKILGHDFFS